MSDLLRYLGTPTMSPVVAGAMMIGDDIGTVCSGRNRRDQDSATRIRTSLSIPNVGCQEFIVISHCTTGGPVSRTAPTFHALGAAEERAVARMGTV